MVLPTDTASWSAYYRRAQPGARRSRCWRPARRRTPGRRRHLARPRLGGVLPDHARCNANQGRSFALHPVMGRCTRCSTPTGGSPCCPTSARWCEPTDQGRSTAHSHHAKPAKLFSHNDQQNDLAVLAPEGATPSAGAVAWATCWPRSNARRSSRHLGCRAMRCGWPAMTVHASTRSAPTARSAIGGTATAALSTARRLAGAAMQRIVRATPRRAPVRPRPGRGVGKRSMDAEVQPAHRAGRAARDGRHVRHAPAWPTTTANNAEAAVRQPAERRPTPSTALAQQLQVVARMIDASAAGRAWARQAPGVLRQHGRLRHPRWQQNTSARPI